MAAAITVIGVMPPGFAFPPKAEIWQPLCGFRKNITTSNGAARAGWKCWRG